MSLSRIKRFLKVAQIMAAGAALLVLVAPKATTQQVAPNVNWRQTRLLFTTVPPGTVAQPLPVQYSTVKSRAP